MKTIMLAFFLVLTPLFAISGDVGSVVVVNEAKTKFDLQRIVVIAREKYELIAAQKAKIEETKFSGAGATAWQNPYLYAELGRLSEPAGRGLMQEFRLTQPFYFPGKRGKQAKVFAKEKEIRELSLEEMQQNIALEAVYFAYAYKVAEKKSEHINRRISRFSLIKTFMRSQAFASPQKIIERNIVSNQLITLQKYLNSAISEKKSLWHKLNLYLNESSEVEIEAPWITELPESNEVRFQQNIKKGNYSILKKKIEMDKLIADIEFQRSLALPDMQASFYYRREESGPNVFYGSGVTVPLPVLNRNQFGIKAAEKRLLATQNENQFLEREIGQNASALYAEYNQKRKLLDELKADRIPGLEKQMKFADRELKLGRVDILSYLELELQTNAALHAYYDSQLDLVNVILRMIHLQGRTFIFTGVIDVF